MDHSNSLRPTADGTLFSSVSVCKSLLYHFKILPMFLKYSPSGHFNSTTRYSEIDRTRSDKLGCDFLLAKSVIRKRITDMRNECERDVLFSRGPVSRSHHSSARNTQTVLISMQSFVHLTEFRWFGTRLFGQCMHKIRNFAPWCCRCAAFWKFEYTAKVGINS